MSDDKRDERVKPELPGGFQDYGPSDALARSSMFAILEDISRRFGFVPLETSVAQLREVLTGGKPAENVLWNMRRDRSGATTDNEYQVTARFDLTVPLARFVAENMGKIKFPFRRFERGEVFRGESAQKGRYNGFTQFDADIVGAPCGPADAEIIAWMAAVMAALGIERFLIKINDRKVLNGFCERVGFATGSPNAVALMRVMDKADKVGIDGVLRELSSREAADGEETAFAFDEARLELVRSFMTLCEDAGSNDARLERLEAYFGSTGLGAEGASELRQIAALVRAAGVAEDKWVIDTSVARGLGYYTGPVFETTLLDLPRMGSVCSGGRYDDLLARFTGQSMPCVGASVGVSRLLAALEEIRGSGKEQVQQVEAFIIPMSQDLMADCFALATAMRRLGIVTEIGMSHQDTSAKGMMATGLSRGASFLLFYGPDDKAKGTVAVKDTAARKQESVVIADVPRYIFSRRAQNNATQE